jgi:hypothetical protein
MTKYFFIYATLACILALQTGCVPRTHIDSPSNCGDPLAYYNVLSTQIDNQSSTTETSDLTVDSEMEACFKLYEAIRLSMPGSKQQDDKKALILLKDLNRNEALSNSDRQFSNMLLEHVSQRQNLRNMIGIQDEQLKKTETQLDQLKNIEVEINKKERSVTSPVSE